MDRIRSSDQWGIFQGQEACLGLYPCQRDSFWKQKFCRFVLRNYVAKLEWPKFWPEFLGICYKQKPIKNIFGNKFEKQYFVFFCYYKKNKDTVLEGFILETEMWTFDSSAYDHTLQFARSLSALPHPYLKINLNQHPSDRNIRR